MSEELKKVEAAQKKLGLMEVDLKKQAEEIDGRTKEVEAKEEKIKIKEEKLTKKLGVVDAGGVFDSMVSTVNTLYGAYYSIKGTDEGLLEAIQSILQARQSINKPS